MEDEGKKKKKKEPIIIGNFDVTSATFPKLQEFTLTLYEKLLLQREERSYFQLQRDKLRIFLENTRCDINKATAVLNMKEKQLEEGKERYRNQMKEVNDELKFLLYDQGINLDNVKNEIENKEVKSEEENDDEFMKLLEQKKCLKEAVMELEFKQADEMRVLREQNLEEIMEIKIQVHHNVVEMEIKFNRQLNKVISYLKLKHEITMAELEERKNLHISELLRIHKHRFDELRNHYNTITKENLMVIKSLQDSIEKMGKKEKELVLEIKEMKSENSNLEDLLNKTKEEEKKLAKKLEYHNKNIRCLTNTNNAIIETNNKIEKLKIENFKISEKIEQLKSDNDLPDTIKELKGLQDEGKGQVKKLQNIIQHLLCRLETKDCAFKEMARHEKMKNVIDKQLNKKHTSLKDLKYHVCVLAKMHDDLIHTYEKKLEQFGVKSSDGYIFEPFNLTEVGQGPAGLVTDNM